MDHKERCAPGTSRWFFRFRFAWQRSIERLTDEEAGKLVKAMLYYAMTGQEIELPDKAAGTLNALLNDLDEDAADADRIAERNRANRTKNLLQTRSEPLDPTGDQWSPVGSSGGKYKNLNKKDSITPYSPPRGGRRRKQENTQYSAEDLQRMERNEVDLGCAK